MRYFLLFAALFFLSAHAQKKYTKVTEGFMMVLEQGDDIYAELTKFTELEKVQSATFTGFGFVNMEFGYFNFQTKEYEPKTFNDVELITMNGSIGRQKGKPSIHAHGVVAGRDFTAHGGHILKGTVGTGTLEIAIRVYDKKFERIKDEKKGFNVLCLENCSEE